MSNWIKKIVIILLFLISVAITEIATPRFIKIYSDIGAELPGPTKVIVASPHTFSLMILLLGIILAFFVDKEKVFLPLSIIIAGVVLGFLVVSLYLPLFNIVNVVK